MEYYNDNRTPLERIDDSFLAELLEYDDIPCRRSERNNQCPKESCGYVRANTQSTSERPVNDSSCSCNDNHESDHIECRNFTVPKLKGYPLAMVYSPHQEFEDLYDCELALTRGTIFKALDFPFYGTACNRSKQCKQCR